MSSSRRISRFRHSLNDVHYVDCDDVCLSGRCAGDHLLHDDHCCLDDRSLRDVGRRHENAPSFYEEALVLSTPYLQDLLMPL